MAGPSRDNALDHVVVVLFENRSLDNVLGRLYGPGDGKTFEGVLGKDLSNPIPAWAEHGADRKVVPYTVATDMDSPNPDSGEEYPHTNTQLFNIQNEQNRFKLGADITAPYNAPLLSSARLFLCGRSAFLRGIPPVTPQDTWGVSIHVARSV